MGLDIYLNRYDGDIPEITANEAAYESACDKNWKLAPEKYEDIPEDLKEEIRAKNEALKAEFGIVGYRDKRNVQIEENSSLWPDHYFKIGYCRSSYNGSGFDRVVPNLGLMSLAQIFGQSSHDDMMPDWEMVRKNATATAEAIRAKIAEGNNFRSMFVGQNMFAKEVKVKTAKDALDLTVAEFTRSKEQKGVFECYSNLYGEFMLSGMEIVAAIPGAGLFNEIGVYLVYRDKSLDWYAQACDIIVETCDYVAIHPGNYLLHWSG